MLSAKYWPFFQAYIRPSHLCEQICADPWIPLPKGHYIWRPLMISFCYQLDESFQQIVEIPVMWDALMLMWHHYNGLLQLTHWGRVTHICVSKLTIIGPDNGLSPGRRQAIIWTNAGILLIGPLGTNFSEILIEVCTFSFKKMHLNMSSAKWRPFCLGLNELSLDTQIILSYFLHLRQHIYVYIICVYIYMIMSR